MPNQKYPVQLYNRSNSYITAENGATAGATLGYDLVDMNGNVIPVGGLLTPSTITQTITNGDTTHVPSGDAVFDALTTKVSKAGDVMTGNLDMDGATLRVRNFSGLPGAGVVYFGDVVTDNYIYKTNTNIFLFRFGTNQATLNAAGTIYTSGNFDPATKLNKAGDDMTGQLRVTYGAGPAIKVRTSDGKEFAFGNAYAAADDGIAYCFNYANTDMVFGTNGMERGRILAGGRFQWAGTVTIAGGPVLTSESAELRVEGRIRQFSRPYYLSADAATWIEQPRIFVQNTDPGAKAADGDIWINTT